MEYRTALLFLFLYYIRPQDWVPGIAGVSIVRPMIILWLLSIMTARTRPVVSGILRTPHDWAMLAYFAYVVWNSPDSNGTLKAFFPFVVFYVFTLRSLSTWERVLGYLKTWNYMLLGISFLAVASLHGLDITNAKSITDTFQGRLSLGTWLHNNPNALAHSAIVALPLSYVLFFWKRPAMSRLLIFPLMAFVACYCVYETKSKGSFLMGGILVVLLFVVGRPKLVQVFTLCVAATLGVSALSFLPRMEQMGNLRGDEGVMGRLMVWEEARRVTETIPRGVGWRQFVGQITWEGEHLTKATHSSYVQIGGDLGIYGLFFYLLPLCICARSLLLSANLTRDNPDRERCRRGTMLLLISYMISGWMINREYHTEYFLFLAVAAAMHRLHLADELALIEKQASTEEKTEVTPEQEASLDTAELPEGLITLHEAGKKLWNRISLLDASVTVSMTWAVLFTWDYVLKNL